MAINLETKFVIFRSLLMNGLVEIRHLNALMKILGGLLTEPSSKLTGHLGAEDTRLLTVENVRRLFSP